MEFVHYPLNPEGQGLHKIADMYVADHFDLQVRVTPSASLRALIESKDLSEELRSVFEDLLVVNGGK